MKRRKPPGLSSALGSLFRTALDQLGSVREAVDRGTQLQRSWFDTNMLQRKRKEAFALLGEAVYRTTVAGQLDRLADDPQFRRLVDDIDDLDQRIEVAEARAAQESPGFGSRPAAAPRRRHASATEPRVWRPVASWQAPAADDSPPPSRRRTRTGEVPGVPSFDPSAYPDDYDPLDGDEPPGGVIRAEPRRARQRIDEDPLGHRIAGDDAVSAFSGTPWQRRADYEDEDDDLEQYMHEDDVPEGDWRPAAEAPGSGEPTPASRAASDGQPRRRSRAAAAKAAKRTAQQRRSGEE